MDYDRPYHESSYGDRENRRPFRGGGGYGGGERQGNPPLMTEKLSAERKMFFLDLKENNRGRVLKITEDVRGRRDTIMVPAELLSEFYEAIGRILEYERSLE